MFRNTALTRPRAVLAAFACVVTALSWPSAGANAAAVNGQLSGRVQNDAGATVASAEVSLANSGTQTPVARTTTDSNGAYALAVPKGTYDATVTTPGAKGTAKVGRLRGIAVGANSKLTVALVLPPEVKATFSGVLRTHHGDPLSGVTLSLSSNRGSDLVTTGADGRFSLSGPPGHYNLSIHGGNWSAPPGFKMPAHWAFNVSDLELTKDRAQDITVPSKDVTVTVRAEDGEWLASTGIGAETSGTDDTLELFPGAQATWSWSLGGQMTDSNGRLEFLGFPGDSLFLSASPASPKWSRISKTVSISGDKTFNLTARSHVGVSGTVRDYDGSPLAGASLSLTNGETSSTAGTNSEGGFALRAPTGSYTLSVRLYQDPDDTIEVSGVPIEVTGDQTLDLTIPGTVLRAHVTDPSGAAAAGVETEARTESPQPSVTLFPGGTGTGYRKSVRTTDGSGNAELVVFENSTVSVSANSTNRNLASAVPREMKVQTGSLAELALRATVSVRGVLDPAVPRAESRLYAIRNGAGGSEIYETTTGAGGAYEFRLPAGRYDNLSVGGCCANHPDRPSSWSVQSGPLEIEGDTTLDLTPPFVHPTVRAYGPDGAVLQRATTSYSTEGGSAPVKGSLAPGLPAKTGFLSGSVPGGGSSARLSVLKSVPFRVQQFYVPEPGHSGPWSILNASGLSVSTDGVDIALAVATDPGTPPTPSTTTTTTTTGGTGPTTTSSTTTTSRPPGPGPTTTTTAPDGGAGKASTPGRAGYWMTTADGEVHAFGDARHHGQPRGRLGGGRAVDLEPTRSGQGYWVLDDRGRVHPYGDARHLGDATSPGRLVAGEKAASLSATPAGGGYWIFTDRGRVLTFGDAGFFGDMSKTTLNGPVLGSVATPSGKGYWMVASDGGIFSFGDATFHGSTGKLRLNKPVMGMAPAPGGGYWLVASDGGIFAFDVPFFGSMGAVRLNKPISGMVPGRSGYLMVAEDGGIFSFGDVAFHGSLGAHPPASPVVSVALLP